MGGVKRPTACQSTYSWWLPATWAVLISLAGARAGDLASLVNPRTGTATPRFDYFASATLPFGMVSLCPDTRHGDLWNAGYRHGDARILSFSHIHNIQTAGLPFMPGHGKPRAHLGLKANSAPFRHETETIEPGYHRVSLDDRDITVEMTATLRTGLTRVSFPAAPNAHLAFDLAAQLGPCPMAEASFRQTGPDEITGMSLMAPTHRRKIPCPVHFVVRFDRPLASLAAWHPGPDGTPVWSETREAKGAGLGLLARFGDFKEPQSVQMKAGLSFTDADGARRNLEAEMPGWNFDNTRAAARQAWNAHLSRIQIDGGSPLQQRRFYTDLFRTAVGKRAYSDHDGRWADRSAAATVVRTVPSASPGSHAFAMLDMDCLWGTQWNLNLLWTLAWPDRGNQVAATFLEYHKHNGTMPRGPWGGRDSFVMVGDTATPLLAALACNGRARFDLAQAFAAARKNAFPGGLRDRSGYEAADPPTGGGIADYVKLGYVPVEVAKETTGWHSGGTALTLEYAWQDFTVAHLARLAGQTEEATAFLARAQNYRHVFRADAGWMAPRRRDGSWFEPFSPVQANGATPPGFIEGNAAQYTWHVPHDPQGLIQLLGGPPRFVARLSQALADGQAYGFHLPHGKHGAGPVEYGNQPSLQLAHLFHHAGRPDLSGKWVTAVREALFSSLAPDTGYPGDEDQGQLGALSALMALGLFDTAGLVGENPSWQITPPRFPRAVVDLGAGKQLVISAPAAGKTNVTRATWNGTELPGLSIPSRLLLAGGTLEIFP